MNSIIIYSTKYGTTEKAAKILASKMNGEVSLVNIMKEGVPALDKFDIVILGGSIYIGKIQKKLTDFVTKNLSILLTKKIGLFICGAQPEPTTTKELEMAFPEELFKHASAKDVFGYEFDFKKLGFLDKLIVRKVSGITESKLELSEETINNFAIKLCN